MTSSSSQEEARPLLGTAKVAPEALKTMSSFHAAIIRDVERTISGSKVVVVGMAQNPHVKRVRKALEAAQIDFQYFEYGSYFSQWKERLAIKLWSGWPTFPQVFVRGVLLGGADQALAAISSGSLRQKLSD